MVWFFSNCHKTQKGHKFSKRPELMHTKNFFEQFQKLTPVLAQICQSFFEFTFEKLGCGLQLEAQSHHTKYGNILRG